VLLLLLLDLKVIHRDPKVIRARDAIASTLVSVVLSLLFCGGIALFWSGSLAVQFLTGYVVEYALSVDNLFVFMVVFAYFRVAPEYQHRLLFWGVLGAFVLRASLILAGTTLISHFHWVLYLFGAFLVFTAGRMLFSKEEEADPERGLPLRFARRVLPVTHQDYPGQFFVREDGRLRATPFLLVLVVVEMTDLVFAMDSIPAVMGLSQNAFIVFSSNVCAILGLRSLFFVVASLIDKFRYLKVGLSVVLAFVGAKLLTDRWIQMPVGISLLVVGGILFVAIVVSALNPAPPDVSKESA
jgi:tellurite resistance protein TerC